MFFAKPTQIKFFDCGVHNAPNWYGGIAISDRVICECCGAVLSITELTRIASKFTNAPIVKSLPNWVNVSDYIVKSDEGSSEIKILTDEI